MANILTYFSPPPDFTVWHSHPGTQSQIVITAGVDGDEYAGIEAAHRLIKSYRGATPITVIPCVNIAGNKQQVSYNPLDGRYPKSIFPGSPWGSSSAQLMNTICTHTTGTKLWIDVHGGASDEHLTPFVWAARSGNKHVDSRVSALISRVGATTLFQSHSTLAPTIPLAAKNIAYVVVEAGEMGRVQESAVDYHLKTVKTLIDALDLPPIPSWQPTYTTIRRIPNKGSIPTNVLWYSPQEIFVGV